MEQLSIVALENNNLLKNSDITKLNIGGNIGRLKTINGGEVVYRDGESANSVYMILNGEINLVKKGKGGQTQSVIFSDNEFFGAKELFTNINRCTTTVSLVDSYLIELTKEEVDFLIEQDEKIALNIQKGNRDFKFDDCAIEILSDQNLSELVEGQDIFDEYVSENDINEIIKSINKQEEKLLFDFKEFDKPNVNFDYVNSKEIIDNEVKNNYNCDVNDIINTEEIKMSQENNQNENGYMSSEQFEMIIKSLQLVNANVKRDDVLTNIVDVVVNLTNADRGTLYLVEKETSEIWSKVLIGGEIEEVRLKIGEGLSGWVAEHGETLNIKDVSKDERFDGSFDKATGYNTKNMLIFPIKNKTEETVGVLQLLNSLKGSFDQQEEMFLNAISLNVALALENASLVEQLIKSERKTSIGKMGNFLTYDIKKPLLTCKRYAEHLTKKDLSFDVKQIVKLLLEQLEQVSNQLAAASDYTEGTTLLRKQPVSSNDTLRDFASRIYNLVKVNNCKIEYELGEDVILNLDKKEFYQCYFNIVKNASEALPDGGTIVVASKMNDGRLEISFNDKGIGINNSDLGFVFDPLWTKNKKNNSGLGLAISKKIVGDHGGNISITSEEDSGTTVIISLPIH
jgi:signal transduction histidine kinase/CRP-like cAMP-binding protein